MYGDIPQLEHQQFAANLLATVKDYLKSELSVTVYWQFPGVPLVKPYVVVITPTQCWGDMQHGIGDDHWGKLQTWIAKIHQNHGTFRIQERTAT